MDVTWVRWIDSANYGGWRDDGETIKPVICDSVGYSINETNNFLTLAQTKGDDGNFCNIVVIPKVSILSSGIKCFPESD